jgi:hypothetical protein
MHRSTPKRTTKILIQATFKLPSTVAAVVLEALSSTLIISPSACNVKDALMRKRITSCHWIASSRLFSDVIGDLASAPSPEESLRTPASR